VPFDGTEERASTLLSRLQAVNPKALSIDLPGLDMMGPFGYAPPIPGQTNCSQIFARLRGVFCRSCGKPIRMSHSFIKREITIKQDAREPATNLFLRVFLARCRTCHVEAKTDGPTGGQAMSAGTT